MRLAVQFLVAKNLTVNQLPLETLPALQKRELQKCKRDRKTVIM